MKYSRFLAYDPTRRSFNVFNIFIPSVRKTLFFQKKIKLLNVQFIVKNVAVQMTDNLAFEASLFSEFMLKIIYIQFGINNTTRQATTNKQVEILFKFILVLFSGDVDILRRTSLEILNSLKLRNTKGRNTAITINTGCTVLGMIMSCVEITFKVVWKMSSIARKVISLCLVTDAR